MHFRYVRYALLCLLVLGALAARPATALGKKADLPDPCTQLRFPEVDEAEMPLGATDAVVFWAPSASPFEGIVIVRHGTGHNYAEYDHLLEHLAANGYLAASLDGADAATVLAYAEHLKTEFSLRPNTKVALLGHSIGGKTVIEAANTNAAEADPQNLASVITLAPQDTDGAPLEWGATPALFVLYGSWDEDTTGWPLGSPPSAATPAAGAAGFSVYDKAGTEESVDGGIIPHQPMRKSMIFVHGANHGDWRQPGFGAAPGGPAYVSDDAQQEILRCYTLGFLRWNFEVQSQYEGMFSGGWVPQTIEGYSTSDPDHWDNPPGEDLQLFAQLSAKRRRVVQNFQGSLANVDGGGVVASAGLTEVLDFHAPHATRALRLDWDGVGLEYVSFEIDETRRDVSSFEYVSLRAGQIYDETCDAAAATCTGLNPFGQDQDFLIGLMDEDEESIGFAASDFRRLPFPDRWDYPGNPAPSGKDPGDYSKSAMNTVRVPLVLFRNDVDLTRVRYVVIQFFPETTGSMLFDSIEFAD